MIEEGDINEEIEAVFIEPSDCNVDQDEDSGDEDGGGIIENLTRRQLQGRPSAAYRSMRVGEMVDLAEDMDSSQTKCDGGLCNVCFLLCTFP